MLKFFCECCGHKLTASPEQAGQRCKCASCGQVMRIPSAPAGDVPHQPKRGPAFEGQKAGSPAPGYKKVGWGFVVGVTLAAGLLAVVCLIIVLTYRRDVDWKLNDLKNGTPEVRRQAVIWLAEAGVDGSRRAQVTAALEPLLIEGDVRGDLNPALLLRAYLHWAGSDNVPAMIRMVQSRTLPAWGPDKAGLVMQALGRLEDPRAVDVLAEKLADPALRDQAVDALRGIGPSAGSALLDYVFDSNPDIRLRANQLLAERGTKPKQIANEALSRLRSNSPDAQQSAAAWFAENPPGDAGQQAEVSRSLAGLLQNLSPKVTAQALHALKLWVTKDCLTQLVAFAKRDEKVGTCPPELIDLLARFPDESAAEAIALQLKFPANRGLAAQALLQLGPVATNAVLKYVDHPDPAVQKEARGLLRRLNVDSAVRIDQNLADIASGNRPRILAALRSLARLGVDEARRAKVSEALNGPLLEPDPEVLAAALQAVQVWNSKANTTTLLKLLANLRNGHAACEPQVVDLLGSLQDLAAAPALAEGLTRPEGLDHVVNALKALGAGAEDAVAPYLQSSIRGARFAAAYVLGEIGTRKSLPTLETARVQYIGDADFGQAIWIASDNITARK
jgi:hypothetical protein